MRQPDMPMLRAYKRGEVSAQYALMHAQYLGEAQAIIAEARRRDVAQADDDEALEGLAERTRA